MKAARIHQYGSPDVLQIDDVPCPAPAAGEVLIRVAAAGVGPWDALIREQKSAVHTPLPVTLGSDLAGIVEAVGPDVTQFAPGDRVYGATNPDFVGAYAEHAVAQAKMIAVMPNTLTFDQAAAAPIVAVTAWQMLFDYAKANAGQTVLIHGGGGSVGSCAVQLAHQAGLRVITTASADDEGYVRSLGADTVVDFKRQRFDEVIPKVDLVLDTIGGETQQRSFSTLKDGGILVSVVTKPPADLERNLRAVFFLVDVTTERLNTLTPLFDSGQLTVRLGTVLPLTEARTAHKMLAGTPHNPGKIVLHLADVA